MMLAMTTPSLFCDSSFLRQQFCADASLDARDLRFNQRAQSVAVLFVKCINAAFIQDVLHRLVMQFGVFIAMHHSVRRRRNYSNDSAIAKRFSSLHAVVGTV